MAGIKRTSIIKPTEPPSAKDRSQVDFCRFPPASTGNQPIKGISFQTLLGIATEVCGRTITELTQVTSRGELDRIRERVKEYGRDITR